MCMHSVIKLSQRWEETVSADVFCLLTLLSVQSACVTQKSSVCFTVSYCKDQFKIIVNCVIVVMTAVVISNSSTSSDLLIFRFFSLYSSSILTSSFSDSALSFSDLTSASVVSAVLVHLDSSSNFSSIWSSVWFSVSEALDLVQRCFHPSVFYEIMWERCRDRCLSF